MPSSSRQRFLPLCALATLAFALAACAPQGADAGATRQPTSSYALTRCAGQQTVPTRTDAPPAAQPGVYAGSVGGSLYAFAPDTGTARWCNRFSVTRSFPCPPTAHCPPSPQAIVGKPLLAGNVLYVCVSGYGGYTYAFNASDGSLRWLRQTDCMIVDIPFADYAQPILANGLLYTGKYALNPANGAIRWQMPIEATVGAVTNSTIYAYTEGTIYALTSSGAPRWQYQLSAPISALPIAAGNNLYVGDMNGNSPPAVTPGLPDAHALDARTGKLLWSYPSGIVASITADQGSGLVYIGANALYALDAASGALRWRCQTGPATINTPLLTNGTLYFAADGAYALDAQHGTLRWHNPLGANLSTSFTPSALMNGVMYQGRTDGSGNSTLYALNARTGAELWHHDGINQLSPPTAG